MSAPHILAVDLSLTHTGCCLDGECSSITSKFRGWPRVGHILTALLSMAEPAQVVVLEGYSFGSRGRAVYDIGELGGVVRWALFDSGVPFVDVAPSSLKKYATGKGNSPKDAMIAAAIRRFGFPGSDNNEADAYLLWCMARHAYGHPVATVPQVQAEQAGKVLWPLLREGIPCPSA